MRRDPDHIHVTQAAYDAIIAAAGRGEPFALLYATGTTNEVQQRGYRNAYEFFDPEGKHLIGKNIYPKAIPNGQAITAITCAGRPRIVVHFGKFSVLPAGTAQGINLRQEGAWYWSMPVLKVVTKGTEIAKSLPTRHKANERLKAKMRDADNAYYTHNNAIRSDERTLTLLAG